MTLIGGLTVAVAASALLTAALIPTLRRAGVVDVPVARSLHSVPVPRGGGLAILGALVAGMLAGAIAGADLHAFRGLWLLVAAVLYGSLGFTDDLGSLSVRFRLAIQFVVGLVIGGTGAALAAWHPIWVLIVALLLVTMVNITNFMDGANGLVSLSTVVAGGWLTLLALLGGRGTTALFAICLAGAALGFYPFNGKNARIFLGDVGSYAIGAAVAVVAMVLILDGVAPLAVAAPLVVYVIDTGYTLQLRLRAGQRWYEPHKLHVYQRLISAGWSHQRVTGLVCGVSAAFCLFTVPIVFEWPLAARIVGVLFGMITAAVYLRLPVWVGAPEPWRVPAR